MFEQLRKYSLVRTRLSPRPTTVGVGVDRKDEGEGEVVTTVVWEHFSRSKQLAGGSRDEGGIGSGRCEGGSHGDGEKEGPYRHQRITTNAKKRGVRF